jgi:hypothetical protein
MVLEISSVPRLTEKDTIVIADFANTTGDTVFDGIYGQDFQRNWSNRLF